MTHYPVKKAVMKKEPEIEALLEQNYRLLEEVRFCEKRPNTNLAELREFIRGMIFAYQLVLRNDSPNIDEKVKLDINLK